MLYLAADHAGFEVKEKIKQFLSEKKLANEDLGVFSEDSADYTDLALLLGQKVAAKPALNKGILICGTGIGMCIAANKVVGVRAALIYDDFSAKAAAEHNNANVACFGARTMKLSDITRQIQLWLSTPFSTEERHRRRVDKITDYEKAKNPRLVKTA